MTLLMKRGSSLFEKNNYLIGNVKDMKCISTIMRAVVMLLSS